MRVYADGQGQYWLKVPRTQAVLRWHLERDCWTSATDRLPAGLSEVLLQDLPAALQEEMLAAATRSEALGAQPWPERN